MAKIQKSWITELREEMQGMYNFRDFFVIFWSQTRVVMTTVSCSVVTVNFRRSCYERYLAIQPGAVRKYQYNPWKHGRKMFFFLKEIWRTLVLFCGATNNPVLDFWWRLPWVLKPEWIPHLHALSPAYNEFLRFTSGATPAEHLWPAWQWSRLIHVLAHVYSHSSDSNPLLSKNRREM